ncbi:hypothetical protein [Phascolarctobacterium succinatutens]|uniref:hypothetical protein n=1 Tax=Phascolarctobacterium succinatutens TaxID=626940 RepID=UPI0026ECD7B8|nr:hypothetical protein [Phascolarctobacterium succinatutens]
MLKKIMTGALALTLGMSLLGCGTSENKQAELPKVPKAEAAQPAAADYLRSYALVMDGLYDYAVKGQDNKLVNEGMNVIREIVEIYQRDSASMIGYTLKDFNGDGVPELVLGRAEQHKGAGYYGSDIYSVYTLVDGRPLRSFEGWQSNRLQVLSGSRLFLQATDGDAYSVLAAYKIAPTGEPECLDYYFTAPQNGSLAYYHNTSGSNDRNASKRLNMTEDAFEELRNEYMNDVTMLELIPVENYHKQGAKGLAYQHLKLEWLQDAQADVQQYGMVKVPNASEFVKVVLRSDKSLSNFKVLSLTLLSVDEQGNAHFDAQPVYRQELLMADTPLVMQLADTEAVPANAIAFDDELGRERRFAVSISGMDGSLQLSEI